MNLQPTRHDHILGIFLTNRPALISGIEVVPGISDHEAVCVTVQLTGNVAGTRTTRHASARETRKGAGSPRGIASKN